MNIVSEGLLAATSRVWYYSYGCTLRLGTLSKSEILFKLRREHKLSYIEYNSAKGNPTSSIACVVLEAMLQDVVPFNLDASVFATVARVYAVKSYKKTYKPSRDPNRLIEDDARTWHLRAGHLSTEAL